MPACVRCAAARVGATPGNTPTKAAQAGTASSATMRSNAARERGAVDRLVLGVHVTRRGVVQDGDQAVALVLLEQRAAEAQQPGGVARGDERLVELVVARLPLGEIRRRVARALDLGEMMKRGDEIRLPVVRAVRDAFAERLALEHDPEPRDLVQVLERGRSDLEAALALGGHEALAGEAAQRLAQRARAGVVVLAQLLDAQLRVRREATGDDVGAQPFVGGFTQRLAVRAGHVRCRSSGVVRLAALYQDYRERGRESILKRISIFFQGRVTMRARAGVRRPGKSSNTLN